jgi:hypothetical protein
MKIAVRLYDGTKKLLNDHVQDDNTSDIKDPLFRGEYKEYIEKLLHQKIETFLFEIVSVPEPILA